MPPANPPFVGKVDIDSINTQNTTIELDGDAGKISIGGGGDQFTIGGVDGSIVLRDHSGSHTRTAIDPGEFSLLDEHGNWGFSISSKGGSLPMTSMALGGNGMNSEVSLYRSDVTSSLFLGMDPHKAAIDLRASDASIRAGITGVNGQILVYGEYDNAPLITLLANGNLGDPELTLFKADPTSTSHFAAIDLRASDASIRAGTTGVNGQILVYGEDGNIKISLEGSSGDIILSNADCAEEFDLADLEEAEPGAVMVLSDEGKLRTSTQAYDRRVAGVVSGAGDYRPGIILDKQSSEDSRIPIALVGKVYCKVDARCSRVAVGDLLTTSDTPGHAMKAVDPMKAFGAVIGKALRPLRGGIDLIPILIALQ